ncbi:hypothetical protein EOK75_19255 (plasmid) [Pseudorhodobacter turbinis]|uniref:Arginine transporter n=1 Tax=Pseudorhodobacter turbinis TaxID=2500533 RepID=A0A4V1E1E1_9RHOB|nr:hypothetical protein [Pseudorhodobacter turbinis]QCO57814.1 hypothetical protein EOK75_19255 [Pseudorhodobacter turbinis]
MTKIFFAATVLALSLPVTAMAGPIESACLKSDRKQANRAVCGCIQQVADMTLKGGDQRKAARFFADPDQAQTVRMSKSNRDNEFWARYKNFGETAAAYCGG